MAAENLERKGSLPNWNSLRQGPVERWVPKRPDSSPAVQSEDSSPQRLRAFLMGRDFYSNPQVLIFVAPDEEAAEKLFAEKLRMENYDRERYGPLTEIDLTSPSLTILQPPGDRHLR